MKKKERIDEKQVSHRVGKRGEDICMKRGVDSEMSSWGECEGEL